jgi:phosphopantothenoylcysteine synthetase/decarboxylase
MAEKTSAISGLKVLLGVSGGAAVYKAVDLASKLTAAGALVDTVMTEAACKFVLPKSFEAVTGRCAFTSMWENPGGFQIGHISLSDACDIVVVSPATANIIGKAANGICDDLLSTTLCACWQKKVLFAPAMNEKMWLNPAVQWNVKTLGEMGFEIIGPEKGRLACGSEGLGRMAEVPDIIARIEKIAKR